MYILYTWKREVPQRVCKSNRTLTAAETLGLKGHTHKVKLIFHCQKYCLFSRLCPMMVVRFATCFSMRNSKMKLEWMLSKPSYLCPYVRVAVCVFVCVCVSAGTCVCIYPEYNFICHFAGCHSRVRRVVSNSWTFRWCASTSVSWRHCCLIPAFGVLLFCKRLCAARFVRIRPQVVVPRCIRT
jgi:hypothetical protein